MELDFNAILYALGATGFFSSRAFLPAFLSAAFLRYGDQLPLLGQLEFIQKIGETPTWFTHDITLMVLGGLAVLEVAATKIPEAQEILQDVHRYSKTIMAGLSTYGVLSASDLSFVKDTIQSEAGATNMLIAATVAGATLTVGTFRDGIMGVLTEADPEDDIGIRGLIAWFEDIWASLGLLAFFLIPAFMLILLGIFVGMIFLIRKYLEHREEKAKIECASCGASMYASALICPSCRAPNPEPMQVGVFGNATKKPVEDRLAHQLKLVSKRRCPDCATRFEKRTTVQNCEACGYELFKDAEFSDQYLKMVSSRLPKTLVISGLFSLIPILGLIPGIIYYRISLVSPFAGYIPLMKGFFLKLLLRLLWVFLVLLQVVPLAGALAVPIMALLNYSVYRGAFGGMLAKRRAC